MIIFVSKLNKDGTRMKLRRRLITLDDFPVMSDLRTKRVQLLEQTKTVSNLEKSRKENLSRPLHS